MNEKTYNWNAEDYLELYRLVFGKELKLEVNGETRRAMDQCLATLQPEEQRVLYLQTHKRLGVFQTSVRVLRTPRRVKIWFYRAVRKLRHPSRSKRLAAAVPGNGNEGLQG